MYAVAAGFGFLSLLTMTARSQIVGMVVIASSVVTWIGVHQLGYAEFGEIQRSLRYGVGNERRAIGNNVYLAALGQRFMAATDVEQLRSTLAEAMERLHFRRVELIFESGAPLAVRQALPTWDGGVVDLPSQATSTWRIPLVADGKVVVTVVLTRSLDRQASFDPAHLLNALQSGFGLRLLSLAATPPPANAGTSVVAHG
jgi:hypothetical protein